MRFSIIIPVYNVEKFINKCLNSALQQTYTDYEIVAVNDGSTDSSKDILEYYQEKNAKLKVISQQNKGLGGARNTGIKNSKGEFLVFLDSDDYISIDMLEKVDSYLIKYALDILAFDCNLVDLNGNVMQCATMQEYSEKYTPLTRKQFLLLEPTSCTKVYRRTLFTDQHIMFPERLWYEDFATIFKLAPLAMNIGYLKEPLYYYVQQGTSITHSSNVNRMMEIEDAFNSNVEYYRKLDLWDEFYDELEWNCVLHVLYYSAFRLLGCGYHRKKMEHLYAYSKLYFPDWKNNKYVKDKKETRDRMNLIVEHHYFAFYLKTGFCKKYVNPLSQKIKKLRGKQYECKKDNS